MAVKYKPDGQHTVTPYLTVVGVKSLLDFATRGLGATVRNQHDGPGGAVMHAEIEIGDSRVMMGEAPDALKAMPTMLYLYVPDVDASYRKAMAAGGTSVREPTDEFYGDRSSGVKDPCGNQWWFATHLEDVSPEEMERRMLASRKKT